MKKILVVIGVCFLVACTREIKTIEDLNELNFDENPALINGFRLGFQPDSIGFRFSRYGIVENSEIPVYCKSCKKWTNKSNLKVNEKHSYAFILLHEQLERLNLALNNRSAFNENKPKHPVVSYVKRGTSYVRTINIDDKVYLDDRGNEFENSEPLISFDYMEGNLITRGFKNVSKNVFAICNMFADYGKDTIITEFALSFHSKNNPPLLRLVYNKDSDMIYKKGQIVNIKDSRFEEIFEHCSENYLMVLNENEAKQIINDFQQKFGKGKRKKTQFSDQFDGKPNKTFYREYRWNKGIVNISLLIDNIPPENFTGMDIENPYSDGKHNGYRITAIFKFDDKTIKIIDKEN
jgi:hypothetical protein